MKDIFRFWRELKRRSVHKGIISYVVFSWVLLQVISVLGSLVTIPDWLGKAVLITLLVCFPFWVAFSWLYDITPDGIKLTSNQKNPSTERNEHINKRLNSFIFLFLILAVMLLFIDRFRITSQYESNEIAINLPVENSIAVLPFNDISVSKDQAYFADGLSEELIQTLSKIIGMRVTSRTSAFSFKEQRVDIPTIAERLGVNYILEGSVRTHDSLVRVSVQLIDVKNDTYTWSKSWDKKLENIFQIQNEISISVANNLKLKITERVNKVKETDPEAYKLYLEAKYASNQAKSLNDFNYAIRLLKQSIVIDDAYAPAWDLLAILYHSMNNYGHIEFEEGYKLAKNAALQAVKVDSTYATVFNILGTIAIDYERDFNKAKSLVNKGLDLEPQNSFLLDRASEVALIFGETDRALEYHKQLAALNPLDESAYYYLGNTYYFTEDYKNAEVALRKCLELDPSSHITRHALACVLLFQNNPEEALKYANSEIDEAFRLHSIAMCYHALGDTKKAREALDEFIDKYEKAYSYQIALTYAFFSEPDLAFQWLEKALIYKDFGLMESQIDPIFNPLKKDKRWAPYVSKLGFLSEASIEN